jgi:putative DNA primase/helicase
MILDDRIERQKLQERARACAAGTSSRRRRYRWTDLGNAERLRDRHGENIRYCHAWKQWLLWDGARWRKDESDQILMLCIDTVRAMYAEAADIGKPKKRQEFLKFIARSEMAPRLKAMEMLARSELPITPDKLEDDEDDDEDE